MKRKKKKEKKRGWEKGRKMTERKKSRTKPVQAEVNIGLVGHVDAGKTSLVEALTGKWVDTHSEELKRGISIRIGYADASFFKCEKCDKHAYFTNSEKCPKCNAKAKFLRRVSFVDAPGHETLMATMLSGAALMNGAVLVVAANEPCPQPQTIEHLNALEISGVKKIVVAQNKVDLVEKKEAERNHEEIAKFLSEFGYKNVPIVPTAAHFRGNIDLLIEEIERTIPTPKSDLKKPLKMYCGRSFDVNKPGTKINELKGGVLGGTIISGKVKVGDTIEIGPGPMGKKIITTVKRINCSSGELSEAVPGGLIAIETTLDPSIAQNDQLKGQIIGKPGTLPEPTSEISVGVHFIKRSVTDIVPEIKTNEMLVLTIGTMTSIGTILSSNNKKAKIALKKPVIVEKGQRIAISKREKMKWRLVAYGEIE